MHKKLISALVLMFSIHLNTQTHIPYPNEKSITGKLVYIGPTPRLMYEFTPEVWKSLGLELQLGQIRLDSICYTKQWLRGTRRYYKLKTWESKIKHGTEASKAWGIKPGENTINSTVIDF